MEQKPSHRGGCSRGAHRCYLSRPRYTRGAAVLHDSTTHEPFRAMYILSSAITSPAVVEQIIIKENEQYSAGFVTYLKDYYLFL